MHCKPYCRGINKTRENGRSEPESRGEEAAKNYTKKKKGGEEKKKEKEKEESKKESKKTKDSVVVQSTKKVSMFSVAHQAPEAQLSLSRPERTPLIII